MVRAILTVALCASVAVAEEKPEPLTIGISGTAKYKLDLGGKTQAEYAKAVEAKAKAGAPLATPAVDLKIEVTNTTDKPLKLWAGGDPVVLTVRLKGKGALDLDPPLAFTEEFRSPVVVEIAAGKSHTFALKALTSGFRGRAHFAYWTAPGEYELVAELKSATNPAPKGAKEVRDDFGLVTLTSKPFKVTVE
jgi:hypothetical protein